MGSPSRAMAVAFISLAGIIGYGQSPAASQSSSYYASGTGADMIVNLGCEGRWSDDKKKAIFDRDYKGKLTKVMGKVTGAGNGEVYLAVLKSTLTFDIVISLQNTKDSYDLEIGQLINVEFVAIDLGGCILAFHGNTGQIVGRYGYVN